MRVRERIEVFGDRREASGILEDAGKAETGAVMVAVGWS